MTRRPQSFAAYARRRWRALGLVLVLTTGALLVAALTDRGHDPVWTARDAQPVALALSDDADVVYSLHGDAERIRALEARRGATGALLWSSPLNESRVLLEAGSNWVATATDFPRAFLTLYDDDARIRYQVPLEGSPRALAGDGRALAVALQAPGNPVLVHDEEGAARVHRFSSFVNALDLQAGRLGVGTGGGNLVVLDAQGGELLNTTLPISIRSLRMSDDGTRIVVGGFSNQPGELSGLVAFYDLDQASPLRWTYPTRVGVGFVDLDDAGDYAMAVEESPPRNTVHAFGTTGARVLWSRAADGEVSQDDAGALGGAALSPDGRVCIVSTLSGGVRAFAMGDGTLLWTYDADGTTVVAFGDESSRHLVTNARVTLTGPYDSLLYFSRAREPLTQELTVIAGVIVAIGVTSAALVLGVGYARLRRA